jgi:3-deoxy-D-manno-octulosonic-acid transferase
MTVLYNMVLMVAALVALPYYGARLVLTGKYRRSLGAKFGFVRASSFAPFTGTPRIWLHAVSVGEVAAAAPIVAALRERFPEACLVISTSTETGQDVASRVAGITGTFYYPLDIPCVVRRLLDLVRPDLCALTETELWPNFLRICRQRRVPVVMVNGRFSARSMRGYRLTRFFWKAVVRAVTRAGVRSEADARRLSSLGMPRDRIAILGNAKYDGLTAKLSAAWRDDVAPSLNLSPHDTVFVAGSTHEGEERIVLQVYARLLKEHPECLLVIVPRHIERGPAVVEMAQAAGFSDIVTMGEIRAGRRRRTERVVVVDVIGELFKIYSLATVVFCGGSLVPRGGQNILEPAAWGKVVCYGPFMDDFRAEREILEEAEAGITVRDGEDLLHELLHLLGNPAELAARGANGRAAVMANAGAARRYADLIARTLAGTGAP